MRILKLLSKGPMTYTEIMLALKMDPVRDAGRFVYHLRDVVEAGLVEADKESKKYAITELGDLLVDFARDVEEYINVKKGRLLVRTSRIAIEEFDREKIVNSLVGEAGVPPQLARGIAAEAEERLIRLRTAYLTAPLIREFINAILIERKLEEYRHRLTRLGMPVYDVTQLFKATSSKGLGVENVKNSASQSVMEEYVLLTSLPRSIADSHLSGLIHISGLSDWVLEPDEIMHDLRFFFRTGTPVARAPSNFEEALAIVEQVLSLVGAEISVEQSIDMFNVFLAPFVKRMTLEDIKGSIYRFFQRTRGDSFVGRPTHEFSLGLELAVPEFLTDVKAVGPNGNTMGTYGEYAEEVSLIIDALLKAVHEASASKPLVNPRLIFKLRSGISTGKALSETLLRIHELAARLSLPYFALLEREGKVSYSATGCRLPDDWTGDWQADCLRTGSMGTVLLNLPRLAYESNRNDGKLIEALNGSLNAALECMKAKQNSIDQRIRQSLLPTLAATAGESKYFYEENTAYAVGFVGLNEAAVAHTGSSIGERGGSDFASTILTHMSEFVRQLSEDLNLRLTVANRPGDEASVRLAELDVQRYGSGTAVFNGAKTHPYYTDLFAIPLSYKVPLLERMEIEGKFQGMSGGGHLASICLTPTDHDSKSLLQSTEQAREKGVQFLTYTNNYSHCLKCGKTYVGIVPRCASCSSDRLEYVGRCSSTYLPLTLWPDAKRRAVDKRVYYSF